MSSGGDHRPRSRRRLADAAPPDRRDPRGPLWPRTSPHPTRPDPGRQAYSSEANLTLLNSRGIKATIAQPADQAASRKRRGPAGGRPPAFDPEIYKGRNVVERTFNRIKDWRGLATRYDKLAITYRGGIVRRAITLWLD